MKIEQLYYTRTDSDSSGWKFVGITDGVAQEDMDDFKRVHSNLSANKTIYSFDCTARNYYLSKITVGDSDALGRDICFIHGYMFPKEEKDYIFTYYNRLLNMEKFALDVSDSIEHIDDLPLGKFDSRGVEERLNLENLLEGVYEAKLFHKPLYIYTDLDVNEFLIKAIMCVIYEYLPLNMRGNISFASSESGMTRDITITNIAENKYGITYDYASGMITGITGKYKEFVRAILRSPESYLNSVQKYIEDAYATHTLNVETYEKAISYVLMRDRSDESIDSDTVASELYTLLDEEKYYDQASATYIAMLILSVIKNNIMVSSVVHAKLLEAYTKTKFENLKDAIAQYTAYTYKKACTAVDFTAFQAMKEQDITLYTQVVNEAVKGLATEFIQHFAKAAVASNVHSSFITESCAGECAEIIVAEMAKYIVEQENKDILIASMVERSLHKDVIDYIVQYELTNEMVWSYLKKVFEQQDYYKMFSELKEETRNYLYNRFVDSCMLNAEESCQIMRNLYIVDKDSLYAYIENLLAQREKYDIIDHFYAEVLLDAANTVQVVAQLRNKLQAISNKTSCFDQLAVYKYMRLARKECFDFNSTLSIVGDARMFLTSIGCDVAEHIEELKSCFWNRFDFSEWDMDFDYSNLYTEENEKSRSVELLSKTVRALKYDEYISFEELKGVLNLLTETQSSVEARDRERIIRQLKSEFVNETKFNYDGNKPRVRKRSGKKVKKGSKKDLETNMYSYSNDYGRTNMNMDLYLMMHYSSANEGLDKSMRVPSIDALRSYIQECKLDNENGERWHLINKENVVVDLYDILYKESEKVAMKDLDAFIETFEKPMRKTVQKRIRKITEIPDYTWIAMLAMMFLSITLFCVMDYLGLTGFLTWVLKILVLFIGVGLVVFDGMIDVTQEESGKYFWIQLTSGVSLLFTLLVAITCLI